jgi:hypothetical protein
VIERGRAKGIELNLFGGLQFIAFFIYLMAVPRRRRAIRFA